MTSFEILVTQGRPWRAEEHITAVNSTQKHTPPNKANRRIKNQGGADHLENHFFAGTSISKRWHALSSWCDSRRQVTTRWAHGSIAPISAVTTELRSKRSDPHDVKLPERHFLPDVVLIDVTQQAVCAMVVNSVRFKGEIVGLRVTMTWCCHGQRLTFNSTCHITCPRGHITISTPHTTTHINVHG